MLACRLRPMPDGDRASSAGNGTLYVGIVPEAVLDHRRGDREGHRHDPVHSPASRDGPRCRATASASTPSKRGWRRSRSSTSPRKKTIDTFTLSERQQEGPDPQRSSPIRCTASSMMVTAPPPSRSIGSRSARRRCCSTTCNAQGRAHHPVAERRGAREREHPVLARRQADVPVQRPGRADLRDRRPSSRSTSGSCRGRSRKASAASTSARRDVDERRAGLLHRIFTVAGSGAAPPDHGHRPGQPRGEERRLLHSRPGVAGRASAWRRTARRLRPDLGDRPLRVLEVRSRAPALASRDRVPGPAAHGAEDQLERQGALHLQRRQHDRSVRRGDIQVHGHDHARRRHDDRAVRLSAVAGGDRERNRQ